MFFVGEGLENLVPVLGYGVSFLPGAGAEDQRRVFRQ